MSDQQQMESSIVEGFQNLQVLAAYDFQKMNQLVQELTNMESMKSQHQGRNKEHGSPGQGPSPNLAKKNKKRKKRKSGTNMVWQVYAELGNMSEASESSLDEALKDYMENIAQHSDSDELILSAKRLPSLAFPNHTIALAESDSFTENFSPMRPQRRRKRYTRMAVETHDENELPLTEYHGEPGVDTLVRKKTEPTDESAADNMEPEEKDNDAKQVTSSLETVIGKRKRCMRDKSSNNSFDLDHLVDLEAAEQGTVTPTKMEGSSPGETSSSCGLSSSGESEGIFTNDEGRDGDDEHSDFFHEPGPACGIPGIIPWWENEKLDEQQEQIDPEFQQILTGKFEYMTPISQRNFKARLKLISKSGREIRSGRRRLKDRRPGYSLTRFLQDRQQWSEATKKFCTATLPGCSGSNSNGHGSANTCSGAEIKRRRKTPPPTEGEFVGGDADPIPETNIGSQILQNMGWTPGTGLGADGLGITQPILAYRRGSRKGLGSSVPNS